MRYLNCVVFFCLVFFSLASQAFADLTPRLSAGSDSSMVLRSDGGIWGWGHNYYGALGDGTGSDRDTPVAVQGLGGGAIGMSASRGTHALAVRGDGIVYAWGQNNYGQLGDGTLADHTTPQPVPGLAGVVSVATGPAGYSIALKSDGTLWAWGYNGQKQLGDGSTTNRSTPVQVKDATGFLSNVKDVALRESGTPALLLKNDGTVWNWGYNLAAPTQVTGITTATAIAAGYDHALILKADGTLWSYGRDSEGQLGDGAGDSNGAALRQVIDPTDATGKMTGVAAISARYLQSFAVKRDGTLWAWGQNSYGRLGDGTNANRFSPVQIAGLSGMVAVAAGDNHTVALKSDGTLYAWGYNGNGRLGDNTGLDRWTPIEVHDANNIAYFNAGNDTGSSGCGNCTAANWIALARPTLAARVSAGGGSYAIRADGSVYAWGYNGDGRLGLGDTSNRFNPVLKSDLSGVVAVSEWGDHGLALKSDGTVWAWGKNGYGQLGDGTLADHAAAAQVSGLTDAVAIVAGPDFSVALKSDGSVWSWGHNNYGQLGDGSNSDSKLPVQARYFTAARKIAIGNSNVYALKADGSVWSWGYNFSNQAEPVGQLSGVSGIKDIGVGYNHVLILKDDKTVWSYGDDGSGQLGDSSANSSGDALRQVLSGVAAISAKNYQSFALKEDGTLWSWGANANGKLGDGSNSNRFVPVQVAALATVVDFAVGSDHTLALKSDGTIWSWGYNGDGRLGDNTSLDRWLPVQVHDPGNLAYLSATGVSVTTGCGNCSPSGWQTLTTAPAPAILAGDNASFAVGSDGALSAWGYNQDNRLGDGTAVNRSIPVSTLAGVIAVAHRSNHGVALKSDGSVWGWGQNNYGQVGDGTTGTRSLPVAVSGLANIVAVAAGADFSVALKSDGSVWSWGRNYYGQLGDGTSTDRSTPVQARYLSSVKAIRVGNSCVYALKSDGSVWAWGYGFRSQAEPVSQLAGFGGIADLSVGDSHVLVLKNDNTLWSYGDDGYGQLGDSSANSGGDGLRQVMSGVAAIAARRVQSFALKIDGTLWSWGYNGDAQLGDGTGSNRFVPVQVKDPLDSSGFLTGLVAVSAGYSHTLALKAGGQVYAWGANPYGELGLNSTDSNSTAVAVHGAGNSGLLGLGAVSDAAPNPFAFDPQSGVGVSAVVTSNEIVVAGITVPATIAISGGRYSVNGGAFTGVAGTVADGDRVALQLTSAGTLSTTSTALLTIGTTQGSFSVTTETMLPITTGVKLSAGSESSMLLRADGGLWSWGRNYYGALGDATGSDRDTPVAVVGLGGGALGMSASRGTHALAVRADGVVYAWGQNNYGQLGDGTLADHTTPQPVPGLAGVVSVATGPAGFSAAVKSDGTLWAWGYNGQMQLGDGSTANRSAPVQVKDASGFVGNVKEIALRESGTPALFLKNDGTVWNWGYNLAAPTQIAGITTATAIAAGYDHALILKADGTLWSFGRDSEGQLGDGAGDSNGAVLRQVIDPTDATGKMTGVAAISARYLQSFAVKRDGTLWAWGQNSYGRLGDGSNANRFSPVQVVGLSGMVAVAAGDNHTVALKNDGTLYAWGYNGNGRLGDNTTLDRWNPVAVHDANNSAYLNANNATGSSGCGNCTPSVWVTLPRPALSARVAAGAGSYAIRADGTLYAWGYNGDGRLGLGDSSNRFNPVLKSELSGVVAVSEWGDHGIALKSDGTVWSWGRNGYGQLGDGTLADHAAAAQVSGLTDAVAVAAGPDFSVALKSDGSVWSWGHNNYGQLGDGSNTDRQVPVQARYFAGAKKIAIGNSNVYALKSDGSVWSWGYNFTNQAEPVGQLAGVSGIKDISAGYSHVLILKDDNTLWSYGDDGSGQLGDGSANSGGDALRQVMSGVSAISAKNYQSFALKLDGTLWSWGSNANGKLGDGSNSNRFVPVQVAGLANVVDFAVGSDHTLALKSDGTVWGWGYNGDGRLGDNTSLDRWLPVQVHDALNIAYLSATGAAASAGCGNCSPSGWNALLPPQVPAILAADNASFAIGLDGALTAWGYNQDNRLGDGTTGNRNTPVATLAGAMAVAERSGHGLAVKSDGSVWGWGQNNYGQVGDGTTVTRSAPVAVAGVAGIVAVAAGSDFSVALKSDGSVWSWGRNYYGQLGDGTSTDRSAPVQARYLSGVRAIRVGNSCVYALKSDGSVWSWGYGFRTQAEPVSQLAGIGGIADLAPGDSHVLVLKNDNTLWSYGDDGYGQLGDSSANSGGDALRQVMSDVAAITARRVQSFALKIDGTLWSWGYNGDAQLGDGTGSNRFLPVQVKDPLDASTYINGVVAVSAGYSHTLALKANGQVFAWGANPYGELGLNNTTANSSAIAVHGSGNSGVLNVGVLSDAVPNAFAFTPQSGVALNALVTSNEIVIAGITTSAAISISGGRYSVNGGAYTGAAGSVASGDRIKVQLTASGSYVTDVSAVLVIGGVGAPFTVTTVIPDTTPDPFGFAPLTVVPVGSTVLSNAVTITGISIAVPITITGGQYSVNGGAFTGAAGTLVAGDQVKLQISAAATVSTTSTAVVTIGAGQAGFSVTTAATLPIVTSAKLSAGSESSMALRSDGSLWSWGRNYYGALGDGTGSDRDTPVSVQGLGGGTIGMSASRGTHALAVRGDGVVYAWGQNNYGQLGDGTQTDHNTPQPVPGLTGVVSVATGPAGFSVAVKSDGTLWAWGYNGQKQLGDGSSTNRSAPVQVKDVSGFMSNVKDVALRESGTPALLLKNDGTVWNWGYNLAAPTQVAGITTATAIAAGYDHALILKADGTLWSFGRDSEGQLGDGAGDSNGAALRQVIDPTDATGKMTGVAAISARYLQSFAVKRDGTLWAWGQNSYGRLGDGSNANRFSPVQVIGLSGMVAVAAGDNHTIAMKSDGTLYAWGYNGNGRLGDNTGLDRWTPIEVHDANNIAYFNAGNDTGSSGCGNCTAANWIALARPALAARVWAGGGSYAIRSDGSVYAWGYNGDGRLGLGDTNNRFNPVLKSDLSGVVAVSEWGDHGLALKSDGTVWAWGKNGYGQLGDGTLADHAAAAQVSGLTEVVAIAAGPDFSVALKSDGSVWSWGHNNYGQLGDGSNTDSKLPVQARYFAGARKIAIGNSNVYALKADGSVWSWGYNFSNQAEPVGQLLGVTGIKEIGVGYNHVLILKDDNTVWSYGDDGSGQLGDSSANSSGDALRQVLSGVAAISAKNYQSFALKQDGTLWSWGSNANGKLGDGSNGNRFVPVQVAGLANVVDFAVGSDHTLALKSDGTIWSWGYNGDGRLGDNTSLDRWLPVQVHDPANLAYLSATGDSVATGCGNCSPSGWQPLTPATAPAILAGDNVSFAVGSDGALSAWGYNQDYRLGDGSAVNRGAPVKTVASMIAVAQRNDHGVALKSDGTVWSWGKNGYGQLGNGTLVDRSNPGPVTGLSDVVAVAAGSDFSAALKSDGSVWSWGRNYYGQLGDGTSTDRSAPVQARYLAGVKAIRVGNSCVYALKNDGSVWAWGYGFRSQAEPVSQLAGFGGVADLAVGDNHVLVLKNDNTLWSYGDDGYGQLGDSSANSGGDGLRQVMSGVAAIAARRAQSFALKIDSTLWSWGYNGDAQLGDGSGSNRYLPVQVKDPLDPSGFLTGLVAVSAGYSHTLALKAGGQVYAWGANPYGELGLNSTDSNSTAVAVHGAGNSGLLGLGAVSDAAPNPFAFDPQSGVGVSAVVTSNEIVVAGITVPATIAISGGRYSVNGGAFTGAAGTVSDGDRVALQLTSASTLSTTSTALLTIGATQGSFSVTTETMLPITTGAKLSAGSESSMLLRADGGLWSWGRNYYSALGDATGSDRDTPVAVVGLGGGVIGMSASRGTHALAVRADGVVYAWGQNNYGQLGDGTLADHTTPQPVPGLAGVVSVATGPAGFSAAVKSDGTLWAWGYNGQMQLGDGSTANRSAPVQVKDASGFVGNVKEIALRESGTPALFLKNDGTVWNWGYNLAAPTQIAGVTTATAIAAGYDHALILKADGTLWSYGRDSEGQLGDGAGDSNGAALRQVIDPTDATGKMTGVAAISARYLQSFAVKRDGTLWAWGQNSYGRLGDGSNANRFSPVQVVGLSGMVAVAAGDNHTVALKNDGTLYAWGYNGNGRLGDNTTLDRWNPVAVHDANNSAYLNANNATGSSGCGNCTPSVWVTLPRPALSARVAAGAGSYAIRADGTLYAWGYNGDGRLGLGDSSNRFNPVLKSELSGVVAVSEWGDHGIALKSDGTVWSWGRNGYGQLGDGTLADHAAAAQVYDLTDAVAVAAGPDFSVALKSDGSVWSWGHNNYGQLGDGSTTDSKVPVQVRYFAGARKIAIGNSNVYALKADGSVWSWGYNFTNQAEPVRQLSGVSGIKDISAGYNHMLILKDDNTLWSYGDDGSGQLGDSSANSSGDALRQVMSGVSAISAKNYQSFALKQDGTLWSWGSNANGKLGDGSNSNRFVPVQVAGLADVVDFAVGSDHTLALKSDGTVWGWGYNGDGRLGDNTSLDRWLPVQVHDPANLAYLSATGVSVATGCGNCSPQGWSALLPPPTPAIFAAENASFSVGSDGALSAWGYNQDSRLGDGTITNRGTPVATLAGVIAVAGRGGHGLALKSDGSVWGWGQNNYGQVGDGTTGTRAAPVAVSGLAGMVAIAAGADFSVALKSDGSVWSWGRNYYGQLGDGTSTDRSAPVQVRYLSGVRAIRVGNSCVYALKNDGSVWGWGYGLRSQAEPVSQLAGVGGIADLAAGDIHVLVLKNDNTVWSYGDDGYGQLGDSSANSGGDALRQVMSGVAAIAARRAQSFALKIDGTLWSWGYNGDAQLGDGTGSNRFVPVQVKDPLDASSYLTGLVAVSAGYSHTLALKANGQVYAWGGNPYGELGVNSTASNGSAIAVHGIGNSGSLNLGILSDAVPNPFAFGAQSGAALNSTATSNEIVVAGITTSAAIGITGGQYSVNGGGFTAAAGTVVNGDRVKAQLTAAATGFTTTSAVLSISGVRGAFSVTTISYYARSPLLAAAGQASFGLRSDGTAWAWGSLGVAADATTVTPARVPALDDFIAVAFGLDAASQEVWYQLKKDGSVWSRKVLYAGPGIATDAPVQLPGLTGIVAISAAGSQQVVGGPYPGAANLVAVKADGSVWMLNGDPVQVGGLGNVVEVVAKPYHIVARQSDRTVWTWGVNRYGQLGHDSSASPQQVPGIVDAVDIAASDTHAAALLSDGTVYCWGANDAGQLGDGTFADKSAPVQAQGVSGITAISAGTGHTLALKNDGTVWAWGYNAFGQVGDGTNNSRTAPAPVAGLSGVMSVAAGNFHSVALKSDGSVWGWGQNARGQVGDGTVTMRLIPARVLGIWGYRFLDLINVDATVVGRIDIAGPDSVPENSGGYGYAATALFTDGSAMSIAPTWSTSDGSLATVDLASGVLTAKDVAADSVVLLVASYQFGSGEIRSASKAVTIINAVPKVSLSSVALSFASQPVGTTSAAQTVTITNAGSLPLLVGSIAAPDGFPQTSSGCGSIAVGGSCTVSVLFSPSAVGTSAGALSIASNAPGSPHQVTLSGLGAAVVPPSLSISTLADGSVTKNATLNVSGSAGSGYGLKSVTINGVAAPVAADGTFSLALTLQEGKNNILTVAADTFGFATSDSRIVTLDTAAPALVVATPADNGSLAVAVVTVSGTVGEAANVLATVNGGAPQTAAVSGSDFSVTLNLASGLNTIIVSATDLAGNVSTVKRTVTSDTEKPTLIITDPPTDIFTNVPTLILTGTAGDNGASVTVTVTVDGRLYTPSLQNGAFQQQLTFDTAKQYAIVVTAQDASGNSVSVQRNVIYYPFGPLIGTTTNLALTAGSTNPSTFGQPVAFTATVSGGADVTGIVTFYDAQTALGSSGLSGGVATFVGTSLGVGSHSISAVYGGDSVYAGSTSAALEQTVGKALQSISIVTAAPSTAAYNSQFSVAATAPGGVVSYGSGSPGVCTNNGAVFTMTAGSGTCVVTYDQAGNGNYHAAQTIQNVGAGKASATVTLGNLVTVYDGTPKAASATSVPAGLAMVISYNDSGVVPSAVGSYQVTATINDANYQGSATGTLVISYSSAPPTLTLSTLADGSITNNPTVNVSGRVGSTLGVKSVTVNGVAAAVAADGSFSLAITLTQGSNTVTTIVTDIADKTTQDLRTITLDTDAPVLSVTAPADNSALAATAINLTGTINKTATVQATVNGGSPQSAIVNGSEFSVALNLQAGINTIAVSATDLAGNSATVKRTVISDTDKPSLAITDPTQDITSNSASLIISGTAGDSGTAVSVAITMEGVTYTPELSNGVFHEQLNFSAAKQYIITVTATDRAGNSVSVQRNVIYSPIFPLTVTAFDIVRAAGSDNPPLTVSYSGFVNGDTAAVLSGEPALATTAVAGSPLGSYPITVSRGTLAAANYSFTFVNGTLTVVDMATGSDGRTTSFISASPSADTKVQISRGTLLSTGSGAPVSGSLSMSSTLLGAISALPAAAQTAHTAEGWSLVSLGAGADLALTGGGTSVKNFNPAIKVTLSVPASFAAPGASVAYYSFDGAGWKQEGSAPVQADGRVDMTVGHLSIWAIAKFKQLPTGKISDDGYANVTISDALRAMRITVGQIPATEADLLNGDVAPLIAGRPSPNGTINLGDALIILRKAVGLVNW